jgi:hypothetical protein
MITRSWKDSAMKQQNLLRRAAMVVIMASAWLLSSTQPARAGDPTLCDLDGGDAWYDQSFPHQRPNGEEPCDQYSEGQPLCYVCGYVCPLVDWQDFDHCNYAYPGFVDGCFYLDAQYEGVTAFCSTQYPDGEVGLCDVWEYGDTDAWQPTQ